MDWDMRDNIDEARMVVKGVKDMCRVFDAPGVDTPQSVFMVINVLCEHVLSLLPESDKVVQEEKKED